MDRDEFRAAFAAVRQRHQDNETWNSDIDEAALISAKRLRDRIAASRVGAQMRLTLAEWSQLTALMQEQFCVAIRHAAYDPPKYPGKDGSDTA